MFTPAISAEENSYDNGVFFSKIEILNNKVSFHSANEFKFFKIPQSGPDIGSNKETVLEINKNEILRHNSIGFNLYWQIKKIESNSATITVYGFIRRVGSIKKTFSINGKWATGI